jgi:hypothetical protein
LSFKHVISLLHDGSLLGGCIAGAAVTLIRQHPGTTTSEPLLKGKPMKTWVRTLRWLLVLVLFYFSLDTLVSYSRYADATRTWLWFSFLAALLIPSLISVAISSARLRRRRSRAEPSGRTQQAMPARSILPNQTIERLRGLAILLVYEADYLQRDGHGIDRSHIFIGLKAGDRKRLAWLALTDASEDVRAVGGQLAQLILGTVHFKSSDLLVGLSTDEAAELKWRAEMDGRRVPSVEEVLIGQVYQARRTLGALSWEDAVWIAIPATNPGQPIWVPARGGRFWPGALAMTDRVIYHPSPEEERALERILRDSALVVHLHNHPAPGLCRPSQADLRFARDFIARHKCRHKARFFVVTSNDEHEYTKEM